MSKVMDNHAKINEYILSEYCKGYAVNLDNCWNYTIVAQDPKASVLENEFYAGFVQAKIQGKLAIKAARDNVWRNMLICGTPHDNLFITIPYGALDICGKSLIDNYRYFHNWLRQH